MVYFLKDVGIGMYQNKRVAALLLMAGRGTRAGGALPKQFLRINGKRVYEYALTALKECPFIDEILLVCHPDWLSRVENWHPECRVLLGGKTRQESSRKGIEALQGDLVLIHDAARPLVSQRILEENIRLAAEKGAVNTCLPASDTISIRKESGGIASIPDRNQFLLGQTPQTFSLPLIQKAHTQALEEGWDQATDDCSLLLRSGYPVDIVSGEATNQKLTNSSDFEILSHFLSKKKRAPCPSLSLRGKIYIILGASGGIGQEISALLEEEGARSICASRSSPYEVDLETPSTIAHLFSRIYQEVGEVDGLLNTAGYLRINPLKSLSGHEIEQLVNINFRGVIYACKHARIKSGGHIINFASSSFTRGRGGYGIYSACKAAVVNFTEGLAEEEPHLRINSLIPPRCSTKMRFMNFPHEERSALLPPKKVAESAISLLKDPHVTGSIVELQQF